VARSGETERGPKRPADALATAVCSIAPTARGRFFWAAWWTEGPRLSPFRKPDASNGGAETQHDAFEEAKRVAGRELTLVEPYWAHAWNRMLRGEAPPPYPRPRAPVDPSLRGERASAWSLLGLPEGADVAAIKQAYRRKALVAHPDRGGDAATFREITRAYEKLLARASKRRRK
jgi:hypothetical protein